MLEREDQQRPDENALDDLFIRSLAYRQSKSYFELLKFIAKFPSYKPFNRLLLHTQNPNVTFVATPRQWDRDFSRTIKPEARPLVILQPFAPVLFVFDLADTQGGPLPTAL